MQKKYEYCVFIGRFQTFHKNQESIAKYALTVAKKLIIVLGTANKPRTIKDPFSVDERMSMITLTLLDEYKKGRVLFTDVNDYAYNDQRWVMQVQSKIDDVIEKSGGTPWDDNICITGNKEDFTSYYIDMFPQWDYVYPTVLDDKIQHIHSTNIRNMYFNSEYDNEDHSIFMDCKKYLPDAVFKFLTDFKENWEYYELVKEYEYIKKYKESWSKAPYAPTFVTTDAVVVQSGHILLIKRKASPGKGLYALPGGFLDQNETTEAGMLRELREETKIKVPAPVLKGNIKKQKIFDKPDRSLRGRTLTVAFLIELPIGELPRIKGSDDAEKAVWLPISDLKPNNMFEDHYDIITEMLGV